MNNLVAKLNEQPLKYSITRLIFLSETRNFV